jgi:hypothetical protein
MADPAISYPDPHVNDGYSKPATVVAAPSLFTVLDAPRHPFLLTTTTPSSLAFTGQLVA